MALLEESGLDSAIVRHLLQECHEFIFRMYNAFSSYSCTDIVVTLIACGSIVPPYESKTIHNFSEIQRDVNSQVTIKNHV